MLLQWDGGDLQIRLNERGLSRLTIRHGTFLGLVDYETLTNGPNDEEPTIWIGKAKPNAPCAEIMINTDDNTIDENETCPGNYLSLAGKEWLKISTDGTQVWLREK